jgi:serine/threonine protein kinase
MQPELIGGRYSVRRAIGQGGMGTVWLCRDETLHRDVAVKQVGLLPGESVTDSARAFREARSSAGLSHRNVVTVFDVVEESGAIWMVMELVPGRSLSDIIKQDGPLDPSVVADIGAQVADGLAAAHEAGTMHRDVKPGNVLIREDGVAKISDFGIARNASDPALTQSGFLTGTPSYFSPELARGADPGPGTDVWALGATLYAAVEGRAPYRQLSNPVAVLHEITSGQPPRPQRADFLEPVLLRMMDRNPDTRWSMADAAHALRRLAATHGPDSTQINTRSLAGPPTTPRAAAAAAAGGAAAGAAVASRGSATAAESPPTGRSASAAPPPGDPAPPDRYDDEPDEYDDGPDGSRRRRGLVYAALGAAALLLVIAGIAWVASMRPDGSGTAASPTRSQTPSPTTSPSSSPSESPSSPKSSPSPSRTPTPTPTRTPSPSPSRTPAASGDVSSFLQGYFGAAPGGTDAGWAQLTPSYQAQIGRGSYNGFWRTIRSVSVSNVQSTGSSAEADLTYRSTSGSVQTERHRLGLVRSGGGYLISSDQAIG